MLILGSELSCNNICNRDDTVKFQLKTIDSAVCVNCDFIYYRYVLNLFAHILFMPEKGFGIRFKRYQPSRTEAQFVSYCHISLFIHGIPPVG